MLTEDKSVAVIPLNPEVPLAQVTVEIIQFFMCECIMVILVVNMFVSPGREAEVSNGTAGGARDLHQLVRITLGSSGSSTKRSHSGNHTR